MARRIRKSRQRKVASVPMAPMIDMVFLLLVFFMTASAMSQAGSKLELDLPESPSSEVPKELSGRFIVSLDAEGGIYLGGVPIESDALQLRLKEMRDEQPDLKLRIRADKRTAFAEVKRVMKLAASSGIDSYLYATYQTGK